MKVKQILIAVGFSCCVAWPSAGQITPQVSAFGDPLVATDHLGRELPSFQDAGPEKPNHYVGLFYWLWHGPLRNNSTTDFDVTKALKQDPTRTTWDFADYYWTDVEFNRTSPDYQYFTNFRVLDHPIYHTVGFTHFSVICIL